MRFEDVLDCVAESAVAAAVRCDVVRIAFDLIAGVSYGDRQAAIPHDRKIDHVVTDECDLSRLDPFLNDDFAKDAELVLNALVNVFEFQVAGAQGNRFGDALGDQSGFDSSEASQRNRRAVMGVKSLRFDVSLAMEPKPAFTAMLGGLLLNRLLRLRRGGEDKQLAVSKDAVDIEQQEFDLLLLALSLQL